MSWKWLWKKSKNIQSLLLFWYLQHPIHRHYQNPSQMNSSLKITCQQLLLPLHIGTILRDSWESDVLYQVPTSPRPISSSEIDEICWTLRRRKCVPTPISKNSSITFLRIDWMVQELQNGNRSERVFPNDTMVQNFALQKTPPCISLPESSESDKRYSSGTWL